MTEPPSHLDLDALADLLAGEADEAAQLHLQACASCASRLAELRTAEARVVAVLGALPPPAVPADLDARLAAALAAEASAGRASVTALPGGSAGRSVGRWPGQSRWLPAAAAAVLLLSGGGLGYALLQGGGGAESTTSAVAGGQAGPDLVLNNSGTDWSDAAAVRAVLPGVLAGRVNPVTLSMTEQLAEDEAENQAEKQAGERARGRAQGPAGTAGDTGSGSAGGAEPLARLRTTEGLIDCLAALLPPDQPEVQPLALDYARYQGRPALAVVLPDPDPDQFSVFVVGEGCSRADDSTLYFVRVPRP